MTTMSPTNVEPPVVVGTGYKAGNIAYNFAAPDQNGNQLSLYANHGRYIILEYCTFWCPVCKNVMPAVNAAVSDVLANDYPILKIHILLQGITEGVSAKQTDAATWATKYSTSPVLHAAGVPLSGSELATDFMNYCTPNVSGVPMFVFLTPGLKILRVQVGAGSPSGSGLLMTSAEIAKIIYDDVKTSPLSATWELRTLTKSLNLEKTFFDLLDKTLGYAITALMKSPPDNRDASNQVKLFNKILVDNPISITESQKLRLVNKSQPILKMLGYGY